jgi:hypothetical protein
MADFQILPFDFNSTTATVVANTQRAKERLGNCAISAEIRKSALPAFVDKLESEGFSVA